MREDEQVDLLSRVNIFESLPKDEVRDLLRQNSQVRLEEGQVFYAPWEHDGKLFIFKKGQMRLYRTEGEREFTLEVVEAGTVFGEMAFTPYRLRESYARATAPSLVFAMERAEVERLIQEKPQVGIRIISLLSERLHYYETRMEDVTLKEVPARLASLILILVESEGVQIPGEIRIPTRYTHEHLGTMIGTTREGVTRAFGRLQDERAVQLRRRLIYVSDVEALQRAAGRLLEEKQEQRAPSRRLSSGFPGRLAAPEHIQIGVGSVPGRRCLHTLILKELYDIFPISTGCLSGPQVYVKEHLVPAGDLPFQLDLKGVPLAQEETIDFLLGCCYARRSTEQVVDLAWGPIFLRCVLVVCSLS